MTETTIITEHDTQAGTGLKVTHGKYGQSISTFDEDGPRNTVHVGDGEVDDVIEALEGQNDDNDDEDEFMTVFEGEIVDGRAFDIERVVDGIYNENYSVDQDLANGRFEVKRRV